MSSGSWDSRHSTAPGERSFPASRASMDARFHRLLDRGTEAAIDVAIRVCGWSAIAFVVAIFYFVSREAAPVLFGELDLAEFFTSTNWRPESSIRAQFGILALLAGTVSVTALAMA